MSVVSLPTGVEYSESRQHEVRKIHMAMVDGNLTSNTQTSAGGSSARVFNKGYWGFASVPVMDDASLARVLGKAIENANTMSRFGEQPGFEMPTESYVGEHGFNTGQQLSQREAIDLIEGLNAHCNKKYQNLKSASFIFSQEEHEKRITTSNGSEGLATINRAACYIIFTTEDKNGKPIELVEAISARGNLTDLHISVDKLEPTLDELYDHLQAKRNAVAPRGGKQTVIIAPPLAGMLAHEAMGHPCEADMVLGGAVTGNLVGKQIASELVTMVDFAHSFNSEELMIPVYVDDEGTKAKDVTLIENGILRGFMSSRETAAKLGIAPSGNARAYGFNDEPLVRMRNTAILPGSSKLEDMIASVENGYYLMKTSNGQADSTTEFMFGIDLAYEINNGRLGNAITDTSVSGTAIDMLQTVDALSDDMYWECNGYCGKKQLMIVSAGGPALRAQIHIGGK